MTARCPSCGQPLPQGRPADEGFDEFWAAYPRRKNKGQARKVWSRLRPDRDLRDRIMIALERACQSREWLKEGGNFIPYPASWLNAEGWEDEPVDLPAVIQPPKASRMMTGITGLQRLKRPE